MSANSTGFLPRRTWLIGAVGLSAVVVSFVVDPTVTGIFYLPVQGDGWQAAHWISKFGDWPSLLLAGLAVVAAQAVCRKYSAARLFLLVLVAGLLTGLGSTLIRTTTGRTRPTAPEPQGFYGPRYHGKWIIGKYDFASFPSGHTATWAGLAGAAWFRRRSLGVVFLLGGLAVAWSRMALGCHHFSDVTAAFVWGFAVGPWLVNLLEVPLDTLWSRLGLSVK
jgi:membrane-associated phospholipid phosphatase